MKTFCLSLLLLITQLCFAQLQKSIDFSSTVQNKVSTFTCNNWFKSSANFQRVNIGDLDVIGNKITIEANFNVLDNSGSVGITTDLVSKMDLGMFSYLLRPETASIYTTDGTNNYIFHTSCCLQDVNKTYHVALVYDGATLKLYRNGFLMSQVAAFGNLLLNDGITSIGNNAIDGTTRGYVNEVRIWNVARTQTEIRTYMNSSLPNPTTQPGLLAYYTFDDLLNKQGNSNWNGSLVGGAINQTNPNCTFIADSCSVSCNTTPDFSYQQNICNPLSIQFFSSNINAVNPYWDFGDGSNVSGVLNPVHVYATNGNYQIKHIDLNCGNSTVKTISVSVIKDDIILTPDTAICSSSTKQLRSVPSLGFCWSPTTFLNDPNSPNPITSSPKDITYFLNAAVTGTNLVVNGDFNNGNTGFTSDYSFANPNTTEGQYFVGTNPQAWNALLSSCKDHTTGTSNMLLVNGASTPDINVWKETLTVLPNTNYAFSTWIQALYPPNPAQLQFSINGKSIGNLITANLPTCTWTQFYTTWNSGNNTTATISIVNKNTQVQGNDFALDDISFAPIFIKRDSVTVTVDKATVKTNNDTTVCSGSSVQLNTTGAATYSWAPASGLSNANIANPVAVANAPVTYIVSGTTANGCIAKDTISLNAFPKPVITKSSDTTLCRSANVQIYATGGNSYLWSPAATLNNPTISNPVASPTSTTTYSVIITDANSCVYKDSIKLTVSSSALFSVSPDQNVCENNSKQLSASGGNSYSWQPAGFLSNPNISNPIATPNATTTFTVKIKESTCNDSALLFTTLSVLPLPTIKASKTNDIDCSNNFSQLNASGAQKYSWFPANSLNDSLIANPIAKPVATTQYFVKGVDINGCINTDTVTVNVNFVNGAGYFMPNSFSPNGDGINDCFGLKYWGSVTELQFSIYNRFGERVFYTTDAAKCWDGRYKGQPMDSDVFIYTIKAKTACALVKKKGTVLLIK